MGETTAISWTDKTWNPFIGCAKVSPGCDNCYMFRDMARYDNDPADIHRSSDATFKAPLKWQREAAGKGEQAFVFTCSWSDFFHPAADRWRYGAWAIMRQCPNLTFQVLTKRPANMLAWAKGNAWRANIWAGVSVESQDYVWRLGTLAKIKALYPSVTTFASFEPLLGPLDIKPWLYKCGCGQKPCVCKGLTLNWAIFGGESGPKGVRRELDIAALEGAVGQCRAAGVPVWVKQDSGRVPGLQGRIPDDIWTMKERP